MTDGTVVLNEEQYNQIVDDCFSEAAHLTLRSVNVNYNCGVGGEHLLVGQAHVFKLIADQFKV